MDDMIDLKLEIKKLVKDVLENVNGLGIDVSRYKIDHIGYRASSKGEFNSRKTELLGLGELVKELIVRDRPISVFRLKEPFTIGGYKISFVEIMAPAKGDRKFPRKFEHVEFLVNEVLISIMKKNPHVEFNTINLNNGKNSELILNFPNNANIKFREIPVCEI